MRKFQHKCELRVLVCQPNPLRPDRVTVGFVLRDTVGDIPRIEVRLASDLGVVRCVYPDADLQAIRDTLHEMEPILKNVTDFEQHLQYMPFEESVDFNFLPAAAVLTDSIDEEVALLTSQYLSRPVVTLDANTELAEGDETRSTEAQSEIGRPSGAASAAGSEHARPSETGRPYIRRRMQEAWAHFGVWDSLHKNLPVGPYTYRSNPLKLDFGYRNQHSQTYRVLHAVSVVLNLEKTTSVALNWPRFRDGVFAQRSEACEMFGIVEDPQYQKSDESQAAIAFMQNEGIIVRPISAMPELAAEAAKALRM
jgi:hypothetical protein